MKFEVDTDTILQLVTDKMLSNLASNIAAQENLTEEEKQATIILNTKKVKQDAQNLAVFFTGLYVQAPVEETLDETVVPE